MDWTRLEKKGGETAKWEVIKVALAGKLQASAREAPRLSHFRTAVCGETITETASRDGPAQGLSLNHLTLDQLEPFPLLSCNTFSRWTSGLWFSAYGLWDLG